MKDEYRLGCRAIHEWAKNQLQEQQDILFPDLTSSSELSTAVVKGKLLSAQQFISELTTECAQRLEELKERNVTLCKQQHVALFGAVSSATARSIDRTFGKVVKKTMSEIRMNCHDWQVRYQHSLSCQTIGDNRARSALTSSYFVRHSRGSAYSVFGLNAPQNLTLSTGMLFIALGTVHAGLISNVIVHGAHLGLYCILAFIVVAIKFITVEFYDRVSGSIKQLRLLEMFLLLFQVGLVLIEALGTTSADAGFSNTSENDLTQILYMGIGMIVMFHWVTDVVVGLLRKWYGIRRI